jgi:hypothetical protein
MIDWRHGRPLVAERENLCSNKTVWWGWESSHLSRKPLRSFGTIAKPTADPA